MNDEFDGKYKFPSRVRLTTMKIDTVKRLWKIHDERNMSMNFLLNQAIERGLPILERLYNNYSNSDEQNIINQKDELIEALQRTIEIQNKQLELFQNQMLQYFKVIRDELLHINASTSIQEYINSSTYQHLKFLLNMFIATNNAGTLSEELSERYDNRIATQFEERKNKAVADYILRKKRFVNSEKESDK